MNEPKPKRPVPPIVCTPPIVKIQEPPNFEPGFFVIFICLVAIFLLLGIL